MFRTTWFTALGIGALAGVASANAFYLNEHDAKNTGRGGASTASIDTPASIVFNPGGIPIGRGTSISIGASFITAKGSYTDANRMDAKTETDSSPAVLPSMFVTSRVHEMVAVGLSFHLPFGLALSWPDAHAQTDTIQDQSLRTYFITPAVGVNLNKYVPGLTLGAGIDLVPSTVKLERGIVFGETRGTAVLGGDAFGIGGRFGVQYRPPQVPQLTVGAMWRSKVKLDYSGTGDFDIDPAFRASLPPDGDISTSISLPMLIGGGVAYKPIPQLQLEANAIWLQWNSFQELRIELPGGAEPSISEQDYQNTVTIRVGAEYDLPKQSASVRVGYIYDPTPIPNTTMTAQLPDADRHDLTVGGSYRFGDYDVHLGLLWVLPSSQTTSDEAYRPRFKGTYEVTAFVASLGFGGTFGK
jgi:long-chain fatty acid transport protein